MSLSTIYLAFFLELLFFVCRPMCQHTAWTKRLVYLAKDIYLVLSFLLCIILVFILILENNTCRYRYPLFNNMFLISLLVG